MNLIQNCPCVKLECFGNVENYYASFNESLLKEWPSVFLCQTQLWTIYWVDTNGGTMDAHPVTGSFENGLGNFMQGYFNGRHCGIVSMGCRDPQHPVVTGIFAR